jgi:hypothetical protein
MAPKSRRCSNHQMMVGYLQISEPSWLGPDSVEGIAHRPESAARLGAVTMVPPAAGVW